MQNNDFWCKITSLCGPQTSPGVLCNQNSIPSIRITSLYRFQPSSVDFECNAASFGPELQVPIGTRPYLSFCARKTARLAQEKLVSMGPSPHLWYLNAKQRLLGQNNKSLCVPALICVFWMQNSDFWTRKTSLYWSQIYPIVLCMQNIVIST